MSWPSAFVLAIQQTGPLIVTIVEKPTKQTTITDLFLGSLALTVMAVVAGLALGGVMGFVLVRWKRRHPPEQDHLPSISPLVPDANRPPSSQVR